jgi:hypothetical protein
MEPGLCHECWLLKEALLEMIVERGGARVDLTQPETVRELLHLKVKSAVA